MRIGLLLVVCCAGSSLAVAGCEGPQVTYAPDGSLAGAAGEGADGPTGASGSGGGDACGVPKNSDSAAIGSCLSAPKFVDCALDGGSSGCLSNGPDTCVGLEGAACVSKCASNQYAVSCGGPATDGVEYEAVPANCQVIASTKNGKSYACCSCDAAQ